MCRNAVCVGVNINGYRVMDMAIAGHSSVDTTGDVTIAPHDFFLPEPEQVFFLYLFVVAKSVVSLM